MDTLQEGKFQNITTEQALFGALIANYRERVGLKQHELSEKMGVNPATWSRIEKGETALSAFQLHALSKILSFSMDKIFADFENFSEILPCQGIKVLSQDKYKKIISGATTTATTALGISGTSLASGIVSGVLPVVGPVLVGVVSGLLTGLLFTEKISEKDEE